MNIVDKLDDPVFQLNTVLWSLIEIPAVKGMYINPALSRAGYSVYAIDRKVMLPEKQGKSIIEITGRQPDPAVPDVWLVHKSDDVDLILEIKSHGFGLNSKDKVVQMLKIMAGSYDLAVSTGDTSKRSGHVIYVTIADDTENMTSTLKSLESELIRYEIPSAPSAVIGLAEQGGSITLVCPEPVLLPAPLKKKLSEPVTIFKAVTEDYDITPFYLVPWSPGFGNTSDFEKEGLELLTERILIYVTTEVGRNTSAEKVSIDCEEILNKATLDVFKHWHGDIRKRFIKTVKNIIISRTKPHGKSEGRSTIDIDLSNGQRDDILKKLARAKVKDISGEVLEATIPAFFDDMP